MSDECFRLFISVLMYECTHKVPKEEEVDTVINKIREVEEYGTKSSKEKQ